MAYNIVLRAFERSRHRTPVVLAIACSVLLHIVGTLPGYAQPALVATAHLSVTKTRPATAPVGTDFASTMAVSNAGPDRAESVALSDILTLDERIVSMRQLSGPAFTCAVVSAHELNCTRAYLDSGASSQFEVVTRIASTVVDGTPIGNTTRFNSNVTLDPDPSTNTFFSHTQAQNPDLPLVGSADLSVTKTRPATAFVGSGITSTITVSNAGPFAAHNVSLQNQLAANGFLGESFSSISQVSGPSFSCTSQGNQAGTNLICQAALLRTGESAQFEVRTTVNIGVDDGFIISDTGSVSAAADSPDPNPANNNFSVTTQVLNPNQPTRGSADLSVMKNRPATALPDTNITSTLTVSNAGPFAADSVSLEDHFASGPAARETFVSVRQVSGPDFLCTTRTAQDLALTCTRTSLRSGGSAQFEVVTHVAAGLTNGMIVGDMASISAGQLSPDPNPANNSFVSQTLITGPGGGAGDGVGGPGPQATPELDSLVLFGSGLSGLGGYVLMRIRARRRVDSRAPRSDV